jgi:hypothetical protein
MSHHNIISRVYFSSASTISVLMLVVCMFCGWRFSSTIFAITGSLLICAPALLVVNIFYWLLTRIEMQKSIVWIIMMAALPLMVAIPAFVFADQLPGNGIFLAFIGLISCYAGILSQALSISDLFDSIQKFQ